jgi:H+/Cl- antiporter ClcA
VIPHFLDLRVLVVKAVGSTFAVRTGMCLGKMGRLCIYRRALAIWSRSG